MKRRIVLNAIIALSLLAGSGYGFYRLKRYVERDVIYPQAAPQVTMKARPPWMSDALAGQIIASAQPQAMASALDPSVLQTVYRKLAANPWVKQVRQARRVYGKSAGDTIEIDCEYRAPIALVSTRNEYILVDGEGVRLPEKFPIGTAEPRIMFSSDGLVNIRIIDGVAAAPPGQPGQPWSGEDLKAGLDLVKLLYGRPYAEEIYRIDVGNFAARQRHNDPQIVLVTRYRSHIWWGEPVVASFHVELTPVEKLRRLEFIKQHNNRIDLGLSWLDIRIDDIGHLKDEQPIVRAGD